MNKLKIGLTEAHGMVKEYSEFPGPNVTYSFLHPQKETHRFFKSPIKGYFRTFNSPNHDLIEASISPIVTDNDWIYSIANFQEALAFNFLGAPIPKKIRALYMGQLFRKDNFKQLIFWSEAGKKTLSSYGNVTCSRILEKTKVVYPAVRQMDDSLIQFQSEQIHILFGGDFFRKGGANAVDAFEETQKLYPEIRLRLCCDPEIDFNTGNQELKLKYLKKIELNPSIQMGRVPRSVMINDILPKTDIFLSPTYYEAFGFAFLEAMAFGIPIITTDCFAIPEIVEHGKTGFLIKIKQFDPESLFQGYQVNRIPQSFFDHVTQGVYEALCTLIASPESRKNFGMAALETARSKFSMERRNRRMDHIYQNTPL
nr:glycosyltransferase family 4 protein [uncultured Desulfobacter sp.]